MKIGYFSSKFPYKNGTKIHDYYYGGSVFATYYLASEMAKLGHDVHIFTSSFNSKDFFEEYGGMKIHRYGTSLKVFTSNISCGSFYKPLPHDVDLIHVSFDIPPFPYAGWRFSKKKKVPMIVTYHGDWDSSYGNIIRRLGVSFFNHFVNNILAHAKVIISPSNAYIDASRFLKNYRGKVVVVPNGINLNEFNIPYTKEECREKLGLPVDKNILLFFGYLVPYKSPDVLLKAFPKVLREFPNSILVFAGSGIMEESLKKLAKELGVEKDVRFAGFIKKEFRPFYYRASDVFCLPSTLRTESFGIVNLEAMACGVPIVASKIGGIPDIVKDGENGLLVLPGDSDILADAIIYLLKNESVREKMGEDGRNKVGDYSWEKIAEETEKIYKRLI